MTVRVPASQRHAWGVALGLALVAACAFAAPAHGQVLRCTDARTGAVSYTDGSCDTGRKVEQVLPARSAQALALEREEAAQAIARKEQRLRDEAAAAALNPALAPSASPPASAESPRCGQSRQQLQTLLARPGRDASAASTYSQQLAAAQQQMELDCLGPQAHRELAQARSQTALPTAPVIVVPPLRPHRPLPPAAQPQRPAMAHCNVFRCYDRQGNIYPR